MEFPRTRAPALASLIFTVQVLAGQGIGSAYAQYGPQRAEMVNLIVAYGVQDSATLAAMRSIPRHEFVPGQYRTRAYRDSPLPIGYGQTISQPYIVAFMTEILQTEPGMKVLEVGTGSGYQAAVLAKIGCEVYTVELFEALADRARWRMRSLGFTVGFASR